MAKYKTEFTLDEVVVLASCKDINCYGEPVGLSFRFRDTDGHDLEMIPFDTEEMEDVEELAIVDLYAAKFNPEL